MNRGRRGVAAVAAVVVFGAAVLLGLLQWILGLVAEKQEMSVGGVSATAISVSAWVGGAVLALFLLLCGVLLARVSVTDRPPRRLARVALVGGAVLHAVLGALAVGLVGWSAFAGLMVVFGLIVLTLTLYPPLPAGVAAASGPEVGDRNPGPFA
ncbi:hypothetical protein [Streptomyces millisiae]|uniref:Integral membrane protein n=1 Tax=Streptomyces millisiae TaxID=3075542 RepID=A0ABU2LXP4_9ACTN|nr:hypothetical protein [Streptomyces sp. DSM 44918]MDT0322354.1 hypothetical protein [Streptomyces sp. DSM 44918]